VTGDPEAWPPPRPRKRTIAVDVAVGLVERAGRVLLERPADGSPFRGRWDLPAIEPNGEPAERALERALGARGLTVSAGDRLGVARHGILHRRLLLTIVRCRLRRGRVTGSDDLRWADPDDLAGVAVSGATHKVLRAVER